ERRRIHPKNQTTPSRSQNPRAQHLQNRPHRPTPNRRLFTQRIAQRHHSQKSKPNPHHDPKIQFRHRQNTRQPFQTRKRNRHRNRQRTILRTNRRKTISELLHRRTPQKKHLTQTQRQKHRRTHQKSHLHRNHHLENFHLGGPAAETKISFPTPNYSRRGRAASGFASLRSRFMTRPLPTVAPLHIPRTNAATSKQDFHQITYLRHRFHSDLIIRSFNLIVFRHKNHIITQFLSLQNPLLYPIHRTNLAAQSDFTRKTTIIRQRNIHIRRQNRTNHRQINRRIKIGRAHV